MTRRKYRSLAERLGQTAITSQAVLDAQRVRCDAFIDVMVDVARISSLWPRPESTELALSDPQTDQKSAGQQSPVPGNSDRKWRYD
ncbi:hypothetical protein Mycsm_01271 [Mycobacterium sp. JS623]|uniref:hypothetical protein n=1 Tax=Mycobacterium sp. JS623 TaxID=212767 RepID=UPI0002A5590D|nr:hypothetical protein [Mycobacterium sp. JS623]AGB21688.1 hypothetical protein Mycsm_01271 [Mycobacterium sp. JS623]